MGKDLETEHIKIKDLFTANPLLTGRTEIDTQSKLNVGLVWSCKGTAFHPPTNDFNDMDMAWTDNGRFKLAANTGDVQATASVNLPNGAKVTGVIVYADGATGWTLDKINISGTTVVTMASAAEDTEDTSITEATIDNLNFAYILTADGLTGTDTVFGARITYTV